MIAGKFDGTRGHQKVDTPRSGAEQLFCADGGGCAGGQDVINQNNMLTLYRSLCSLAHMKGRIQRINPRLWG
ncbi:hypothetical protein AA0311_2714 [Asaia bogorensis NBRC 16594]|uniref:Uncharacterized protein n=2 Tax=Asaia bogorensis TaxID=91915 RepID=A0AAN4U3V6_9PROT|nr:hypothetical protein AA0311_2714 [Asaia bogorensis NBRC 16594]GEL54070.1 hypothetical protein ABO01nite_20770 [Asaia bogorensis NBRC 16594]